MSEHDKRPERAAPRRVIAGRVVSADQSAPRVVVCPACRAHVDARAAVCGSCGTRREPT